MNNVQRLKRTNEDGTQEEFSYRGVAARLPDFLAEYPPRHYAIRTAVKPDVAGQDGFVMFEAKLVQLADGGVVANAHSRGRVGLDYKDFEFLETAALQRLMARLNHGGEVLGEDESRDQKRQKLATLTEQNTGQPSRVPLDAATVEPDSTYPDPEPVPESFPETTVQNDVGSEAEEEPETDTESAEGVAPENTAEASIEAPSPAEEASDAPEPSEATDGLDDRKQVAQKQALTSLQRQIGAMARKLGEEPPEVSSIKEAKNVLNDYLKRQRAGGA
ncbi:hypothetical protein [Thioalkalivibrio sp. ALE16]|uniref:hypothetical protein n=1 Tax=Thioalkalivibrio sp. ALE16 TaxID=1158172 RepID=UPI00036496C7|nr:hypothetical protein [Thioalkalivibrio sp. ALE16]